MEVALAAAALLVAAGGGSAQVALALGGGLTIASFEGEEVGPVADPRFGLLAGGFVSVPLSGFVSLTSGIQYAQKGARGEEAGVEVTAKLDYVVIPLLLQLNLAQTDDAGVHVFLGPSVAFEIGCSLELEGGSDSGSFDCDRPIAGDDVFQTRSVDLGAVFGAGARFDASESTFVFGNGGIDLGLRSIDDGPEEADIRNSMWFVQAGVGWMVGSRTSGTVRE